MMLSRTATNVARTTAKVVLQLWPLALVLPARSLSIALWRDHVLTPQLDHSARSYLYLFQAWPSAALAGPIILMFVAVAIARLKQGALVMAVAGIASVAIATVVTIDPEWVRLSPYIGRARPFDIVRAIDISAFYALASGIFACGVGIGILRDDRIGAQNRTRLARASSDNHGHADWLDMRGARALFPGPDTIFGGIVVGEAYRVDQDRSVRGWRGNTLPFDPSNKRSWGCGGSAPLLIDPCRNGPTHALVFAGSGGFKTTSIGVPTCVTWTTSLVVLDPSREIGPMVSAYRERELGQKVITLDTSNPATGSFNALDWIDITAPEAEANVEAVAGWLTGEAPRGTRESGTDFFREMGQTLIACILADILWDDTSEGERTLRRLRQVLVTPEEQMRKRLQRIYANSASTLARDLAGTLMELVPETFSGVYINANKVTKWLSTKAYADLVSGNSFHTQDLCAGRLTVFVQIPLKVLQATPGLGRIVIGSLLNAAYEADGRIHGRILFLLDEVARLGTMSLIETARDAGRKYRLTLLLLYQSVGQLLGQWGRDGARAWYDSTSWRLYAAVQDPETARDLSAVCGEYGVMATAQGETAGTSGRGFGSSHKNSGQSENRSEIRRALIKPDELLQDTRADEAFVIAGGSRPLRCGRAIYFRRPEMAAKIAPSRFHTGHQP